MSGVFGASKLAQGGSKIEVRNVGIEGLTYKYWQLQTSPSIVNRDFLHKKLANQGGVSCVEIASIFQLIWGKKRRKQIYTYFIGCGCPTEQWTMIFSTTNGLIHGIFHVLALSLFGGQIVRDALPLTQQRYLWHSFP